MTRRLDRSNLRTDPRQIALTMPGEEWRVVFGYEGYFVSDHGRVCSIDRVVLRSDGRERFCPGQLLIPETTTTGHLSVSLGRGNKKAIHILVLTAFVGKRPDGCEGLHWNDDSTNNRLSNLRWGTRSDNLNDAVRNGKAPTGEAKTGAKLTEESVHFIRANPEIGLHTLARQFGVSAAAVKAVRDLRNWKHVAPNVGLSCPM